MSDAKFNNIQNIADLRRHIARLERRSSREQRALNRHFNEFWKPWQSVSGTISSIWAMTSSVRGSIMWWLAKPLLGKVMKFFGKK